ncbi:hypothetical protein ACJMK2_017299 [Sinanodonta woodiana]|uniref:Uncharacterized protein n=1 Tax=Sinanodonta woodiana TaxID=1069815 RepID=A0ABD3UYI7_SINWO
MINVFFVCPDVFNGGYISTFCHREPGFSCTIHCYPGFDKKRDQLTCGKNGSWIQDTNSICIKSDHCPAVFKGGYVDASCSRLPGSVCTFNCSSNFVKRVEQLVCRSNMTWHLDTNLIFIKPVTCPDVFNGGYVEPTCSRVPGNVCTFSCYPWFVQKGNVLVCGSQGNWSPDTNSVCVISESCYFHCNQTSVKKGDFLTCGRNGSWIQDINSICTKSVEPMPSYNEPRPNGPLHVGAIVGISTAAFIIVMIIIVFIVVWRAKRSSVRKSQRVPGHESYTCLRPRKNRDQSVITLRQQPHAFGINSASSFESPSYNGNYFPSSDERIPTVSNSCINPEPPPSYSETQMATNEAPPTYIEAVRDLQDSMYKL